MTEIAEIFSKHLGISIGRGRKGLLPTAKFAAYRFLREIGFTYAEVGDMMGGYSHATVLHGVRKINGWIEVGDPIAVEYWNKLEANSMEIIKSIKEYEERKQQRWLDAQNIRRDIGARSPKMMQC